MNHLLYLMRISENGIQRRVALSLAHLCSVDDQRTIFIDNHGMSEKLFKTIFFQTATGLHVFEFWVSYRIGFTSCPSFIYKLKTASWWLCCSVQIGNRGDVSFTHGWCSPISYTPSKLELLLLMPIEHDILWYLWKPREIKRL